MTAALTAESFLAQALREVSDRLAAIERRLPPESNDISAAEAKKAFGISDATLRRRARETPEICLSDEGFPMRRGHYNRRRLTRYISAPRPSFISARTERKIRASARKANS